MGIRLQKQKVPGSGAGAQDGPKIDWAFYESMRFMENFLKPRHIISSNKLREAVYEKRPECELFAKKRQASKDKYDQEYNEANKQLALAVKHLIQPNDEVPMPVKTTEQRHKHDGFLTAVLDCFDALKEKDKFEGFLLAMNEIKNLKIE